MRRTLLVKMDMLTLFALLVSFILFGEFIWSVVLTISSVILSRWDHRPIRVDLRIPKFPIDIVMVTKADQIKAINGSADVSRVSGSGPFASLPPWVQKYFPSTRFLNLEDTTWFLPLDPVSDVSNYHGRRKFYDDSLTNEPHTTKDIIAVIPTPLFSTPRS